MNCTRCDGTGYLNVHQIDSEFLAKYQETGDGRVIELWIEVQDILDRRHDVTVCDCCGDGTEWHCFRGEHSDADLGPDGPYAYNGGLPECN